MHKVVADFRWLNYDPLQTLPTTSLAVDGRYYIQIDPELRVLRASIWGMGNATTQFAVAAFLSRFLPRFLKHCADDDVPGLLDIEEADDDQENDSEADDESADDEHGRDELGAGRGRPTIPLSTKKGLGGSYPAHALIENPQQASQEVLLKSSIGPIKSPSTNPLPVRARDDGPPRVRARDDPPWALHERPQADHVNPCALISQHMIDIRKNNFNDRKQQLACVAGPLDPGRGRNRVHLGLQLPHARRRGPGRLQALFGPRGRYVVGDFDAGP
jgi:hypothetical protein